MTRDNNYICTSILLKVTKPIVQTAEEFYLQPRSVSVITVQAPTELKPQHKYELTTSDTLWMD